MTGPASRPLSAPRDGVPPVIDRIQPLLAWCEAARSVPDEPVAVDAERASSYRYSQRAYLVQLRTEAAGTALIDPLAFTLPAALERTLEGREWVLHAASQDLPCLAELGLRPARLFDTELAARLLDLPGVGLGAVVEDTLGLQLAKEHSAADWSRRPLPESWLVYAALDVEVLVEVRDVLAQRLEDAGKAEWARQEFEHLAAWEPAPAPAEPWRSLKCLGTLRAPRQLAAARAMWERRDALARDQDLSPHRVLRDRDLVAAAQRAPQGRAAFDAALPKALREKNQWWQAARSGVELPPSHLPGRPDPGYPPPHKLWARKHPEVWQRYTPIREAVVQRSEQLQVPTENLISPGLLRRWVWEHEHPGSADEVRGQLIDLGARPWQAQQVAPAILEGAQPVGDAR
ncbi:HRDC domain-containing protein [Brachybacterium sp. EF45031]|uniref:HRDC domain-containing protein n=1 Tax=Brachybacterium sillae TaxID=2810536 RepID=UPI00217D3D6B|nr:HRDC domain-containing protein [Brachybacterium sillae]MCS6712704.1 HRDC domain-containing protein [Brachybacterium sillae]